MDIKRKVEEKLDYLIERKWGACEITACFEYKNDEYTKAYHSLLSTEKKYNFLLKKRTIADAKKVAEILKEIDDKDKYYDFNNIKDREDIKDFWNIRVDSYAKFKGISKKEAWDIYLKDPMACEDEIYQAVLKDIYGDNIPEYEYRDTPFWLVNHDDVFNKNYINDEDEEEPESTKDFHLGKLYDSPGLAWKILIKDKVTYGLKNVKREKTSKKTK